MEEALRWLTVGEEKSVEEPSQLPQGYSLDLRRGEPDLLILKRPDGSSVAAFEISGLGPDPDRILQIARDDAEWLAQSASEHGEPETQESR